MRRPTRQREERTVSACPFVRSINRSHNTRPAGPPRRDHVITVESGFLPIHWAHRPRAFDRLLARLTAVLW